jgi:hypothetical protein
MIEEAVVDAYNESEQESGFLVCMDENFDFPFTALVVGEEVVVDGFDMDSGDPGVMAICGRGGRSFKVSVTSLEWKGKPPKGAAWIEAYRVWLGGAR